MLTKLKGTCDYYGKEAKKYYEIVEKCRDIVEKFGFQEIITPIIEPTELFVRGVGDSSDVVKKEMYNFLDKGERNICLRPEGTASITRAYVENKLYVNPGLTKMFYFGPMFRYERPQAGRMRQFSQFGVEVFGEESPLLDADMINMCYQVVKELGIDKVVFHINTIGDGESRNNYVKALKAHFEPFLSEMCHDCQERFKSNPLRILDCKVDKNSEILLSAPNIQDFLSEEEKNHFQTIISTLDLLEVPYIIDSHLVRGLDYYTGCVFECILADEDSPLNNITIIGGGRYNGLSKELGGPETKAFGFAGGLERMMMLVDNKTEKPLVDVVVITLGENNKQYGMTLTNYLRAGGLKVEIDYRNHNLKPQFKLADRVKAPYIIIIGDDEVENNKLRIKDAKNRLEYSIGLNELKQYFNIIGVEKYAYKK